MQNLAYAYAMAPIIRRLYKNNEEKKAALERHLEFMSVTPHISTLLLEFLEQWKKKMLKIMNLTQLVLMQ